MYRTIITQGLDRSKEIWEWFSDNPPKVKKLTRVYEKSTFIPNEVMDNMRHLSATAFKVYMYLIRHDWVDSPNYQGCFVTMKTLARETGYSKTTVSRAIEELRTFGWLEHREAGTKKMPNGAEVDLDCYEYTFLFPVDEGDKAILSPTREQAVAYKKWKNRKDTRTVEEKFADVKTHPMRMELAA